MQSIKHSHIRKRQEHYRRWLQRLKLLLLGQSKKNEILKGQSGLKENKVRSLTLGQVYISLATKQALLACISSQSREAASSLAYPLPRTIKQESDGREGEDINTDEDHTLYALYYSASLSNPALITYLGKCLLLLSLHRLSIDPEMIYIDLVALTQVKEKPAYFFFIPIDFSNKLNQYWHEQNSLILDKKHFFRQCLMSIVLGQFNLTAEQLIVTPVKNDDGRLCHRLIPHYNQACSLFSYLANSYSATKNTDSILNALFCFSEVLEPLPADIINEILELDAFKLMQSWLNEVIRVNKQIRFFIGQEFENKGGKTQEFLINLNEAEVVRLYKKIIQVKNAVKNMSQLAIIDLIVSLYPELGEQYQEVLGQSLTPCENYSGIKAFSKNLANKSVQSLTSLVSTVSASEAVKTLRHLYQQQQECDRIYEQLLAGDQRVFEKLWPEESRLEIMARVNWLNASQQQQDHIFTALAGNYFTELDFAGSRFITKDKLFTILQNNKELKKLNLRSCTGIYLNPGEFSFFSEFCQWLQWLDISHNPNFTGIYSLGILIGPFVNFSALTYLNISNCRNIYKVKIEANNLLRFVAEQCAALSELVLHSKELAKLNLQGCHSLRYRLIKLSSYQQLTHLQLNNSQVAHANFYQLYSYLFSLDFSERSPAFITRLMATLQNTLKFEWIEGIKIKVEVEKILKQWLAFISEWENIFDSTLNFVNCPQYFQALNIRSNKLAYLLALGKNFETISNLEVILQSRTFYFKKARAVQAAIKIFKKIIEFLEVDDVSFDKLTAILNTQNNVALWINHTESVDSLLYIFLKSYLKFNKIDEVITQILLKIMRAEAPLLYKITASLLLRECNPADESFEEVWRQSISRLDNSKNYFKINILIKRWILEKITHLLKRDSAENLKKFVDLIKENKEIGCFIRKLYLKVLWRLAVDDNNIFSLIMKILNDGNIFSIMKQIIYFTGLKLLNFMSTSNSSHLLSWGVNNDNFNLLTARGEYFLRNLKKLLRILPTMMAKDRIIQYLQRLTQFEMVGRYLFTLEKLLLADQVNLSVIKFLMHFLEKILDDGKDVKFAEICQKIFSVDFLKMYGTDVNLFLKNLVTWLIRFLKDPTLLDITAAKVIVILSNFTNFPIEGVNEVLAAINSKAVSLSKKIALAKLLDKFGYINDAILLSLLPLMEEFLATSKSWRFFSKENKSITQLPAWYRVIDLEFLLQLRLRQSLAENMPSTYETVKEEKKRVVNDSYQYSNDYPFSFWHSVEGDNGSNVSKRQLTFTP